MSRIEVFCMDDCPNCRQLCAMLGNKGIAFDHYNIDRNPEDLAEAGFRGILELPFPVVFVNGTRLEPATPGEYISKITR